MEDKPLIVAMSHEDYLSLSHWDMFVGFVCGSILGAIVATWVATH
jgi:hypothetical protein